VLWRLRRSRHQRNLVVLEGVDVGGKWWVEVLEAVFIDIKMTNGRA